MPDREKVMRGIEACSDSDIMMQCSVCPYYEIHQRCVTTIMRDAHALLKELEPRVMTRKEIEDSDGSEFYSEHRDEEYMYLDHTEGSAYLMGNIDRLQLTKLRWEDYGKTWRCWTARPSDEQRKEVKWDG